MTEPFGKFPPASIKSGCFRGSIDEVAGCREWLRMVLCDYDEDVVWVAELGASELVTNAVAHTRSNWLGGVVWVRVEFHPDRIEVVVRDNGSDSVPSIGNPDPEADHGRGLALVQALTGTLDHRGNYLGREVWFTLDAKPER